MDQIIPNLWLGNLISALNNHELEAFQISSVLTAMRGKVNVHHKLFRRQIQLDDEEDADIMMHFLPSIHFIQHELDKGRGVLVHCQGGVSRSATIIAAYLMYTRKIDPRAALKIIRQARPSVDPNPGFLRQLDLFHESDFELSREHKEVRMFYLERTTAGVLKGGNSTLETTTFATYPLPSSSSPSSATITTSTSTSTTAGPAPRRRIRCKMCRQDLATREHLLEHGQIWPPKSAPRPSSAGIDESPDSLSIAAGSGLSSMKALEDSLPISSSQEEPGQGESGPNTALIPTSSSATAQTPNENTMSPSTVSIHPQSPTEPSTSATAGDAASEALGYRISDSILPGKPNSQTITMQSNSSTLVNPKCSGYFVEPIKWMDHFLTAGHLSGKILCPNKRCGAKLGNYNWAGLCCGCQGEWVTPGFCINRSKVDEVV